MEATRKNTTPSNAEKPGHLFEPFTHFEEGEDCHREGRFASDVADLATGLRMVLELVEDSTLADEDADATPILNVCQRGLLMRHAIAVAEAIHRRAADILDSINDEAFEKANPPVTRRIG